MYNAPATAPQVVDPGPRATRKRLGRSLAALVGAVVAVSTVGFVTPALAADASFGTMTMNGTAKAVTTAAVGNGAYGIIAGTAGQRVQLQTLASTYTGGDPTIALVNPGGSTIQSWTGNGFLDTVTLPTTGNYQFKATQTGSNGGITLKAWTVSADSTAVLTPGTAKAVTTTQGQNTSVTFPATANQRFQFQTTGSTYGAGTEPTVQLIRPDGSTVQDSWTGNSFRDTSTLATAGTWTIKVDPQAMTAGSITITAWAVASNSTGTLALNGDESNVSTSQGQNSTLSFALSANQRLQLQTSASSYATNPVITVYKPDGTTVVNTWNGDAFFDTTAYATAGTYTMVIDPVGTEAGGITVQAWNVPADSTTPITTNGTPVTFTTAQGQNSTGTFSLTSGQRVMIKTSGNTYGGSDPAVKQIAPDGSTVVQSWSGNALKEPFTVSATGSYTLSIDPAGKASGSITARAWIVPADQTFVAPLNGSTSAITTAPGQNATASFAVTAGQRLMFQTSGSSYSVAPPVTVYRPDGSTVVTSWNGNNLTDVLTFATAGTYTLKVDPTDVISGSMNLRIWNVPADLAVSPALNGAATVLTTTPGQNATASFTMAANSRVLIQTTGNSYDDDARFTLYKPDGTSVVTNWNGNTLTDVLSTATAGTYTLKLDPKDIGAGSITLRVWNVPNDLALSANLAGTAVNVATTPGQNGTVSFVAAANQRVQIQTTENAYTAPIPVTLYGPDGTTKVANWKGNYLLNTTRLVTPGTYQLRFDAAAIDEGSVKVQVWSVPEDIDFGAQSLNGTAKTVTTVPGQNAWTTLSITSVGQRVQIGASGNTYNPTPRISLIKPDGSSMLDWYGNIAPTTRTFDTIGTWKILVGPQDRSSGSITFTALEVPADTDGGNLALDGTPTTVPTTSKGQNGSVSIVNSVAGSRVQIQSLGSTYTQNPSVKLVAPNGTTAATWYGNGLLDTTVLSEVGTYKVKIDPIGDTIGAISIKGWSVAPNVSLGTITRNGTAVHVATTPGQNASMTFTGATGDRIMFQTTGSDYATTPHIGVTRSTTRIASWYGNHLTKVFTLPANGTYTITVDPRTRTQGAINVSAWLVPDDDDAGTLTVGAVGKTVATTVGGQNGFVKFTGGPGEKIRIVTSNISYDKAVRLQLLRANGTILFSRAAGEFTSKVITLPASGGTYKLFVNPTERDTGSIRLRVIEP